AVTWNVTDTDAGSVSGLAFSNVQNLIGGDGPDTFVMGRGTDATGAVTIGGITGRIDGGGGFDFLDYTAWTSSVTVNLATGAATGIGVGISNVEGVLGGSGDDVLTGNGLANVLVGGAGSDTLTGGGGRSILIGGLGVDTLVAGTGQAILIGGRTTFDGN